MLDVVALVLPLFSIIILGYISGRLSSLDKDALGWLNFFIVYIALPALFYKYLSATPVDEFKNYRFFFSAVGVTFFVFLSCFLIALIIRKSGTATATLQGLAAAYGNIGYLGPPLAIAAFGPEAGVPVALIFTLENTMHFTLAPLLMAFADRATKQSFWRLVGGVVHRIFTHPFIIATVVGISAAVFKVELPGALFAMGVTAALRPLKRIPVAANYIVPIKLLIHPALMYLIISTIPGIEPTWVLSAVLLASLPTATNVFVLAQQYKTWEEQASSMVVITTALSMLTVTGLLYWARAVQ